MKINMANIKVNYIIVSILNKFKRIYHYFKYNFIKVKDYIDQILKLIINYHIDILIFLKYMILEVYNTIISYFLSNKDFMLKFHLIT